MSCRQLPPFSRLLGLLLVLLVVAIGTIYHREALASNGIELTSSFIDVVISPFYEESTKEEYDDEYLAICIAVKDQGRDLPEWLQHHYYKMGITRFYIMDDGSSPPLSTMSKTYGVPEEALTFLYYDPSERGIYTQLALYDQCIRTYAVNNTWVAFIDADEFFDTPARESLEDMLRKMEASQPHAGALGVNWRMHTSNGHLTRVPSVRKGYTECIYDDPENKGEASDNKHVKSIVRVDAYGHAINPHMFGLKEGFVTVGEHGDVIDSIAWRQPITRERVSLHHYAVKSKEEYVEKSHRGNAMDIPKDWGFWDHVEQELPHVDCPEMTRWVE